MFRSIVVKIWLGMVLLTLLASVFLAFTLGQFFENFYFDQREKQVLDSGKKLAALVSSGASQDEVNRQAWYLATYQGLSVAVTDQWDFPIARFGVTASIARDPDPISGEKKVVVIPREDIIIRRGIIPGFENMVSSVQVPILVDDSIVGRIRLFAPTAPINRVIADVRRLIFYQAVTVVTAMTLVAFLLSRTLSGPLVQMDRVARGMASGDFSRRVRVTTNDEVGALGRTINTLSEQLQGTLEMLSREKDRLARILESMSDGVVTFDVDRRVIMANRQAEAMVGAPAPGFKESQHGQALASLARASLVNATPGEVVLGVGNRELEVRMAPMRGDSGDIAGIVTLLHDVTKEREVERMRRDFVANVSHELRTPLSYLQGYAEAALDGIGQNPEAQRKYVEIILDETLRLRRLVTDLLDLSQLEAGRLPLAREPLALTALLDRVKFKMEGVAQEKGIKVGIAAQHSLPLVIADEDRVEQVVINLVDNAIRHTPSGGLVTIGGRTHPESNELWISVTDTGEGIPPDELERVWERFYKVDKARTRSVGTGLGLAIVRNIILAHGGQVRASSKPGEGSTFSFSLPLTAEGGDQSPANC